MLNQDVNLLEEIATVTEEEQLDRYVTYAEAAKILGVGRTTINTAAATGLFTTLRPLGKHYKVIPRYEVEALVGWAVLSQQARDMLDELRRQKAGEKEYNIDGTADYESESEIKRLMRKQEDAIEELSAKLQKFIDLDWPGLVEDITESKIRKFKESALEAFK